MTTKEDGSTEGKGRGEERRGEKGSFEGSGPRGEHTIFTWSRRCRVSYVVVGWDGEKSGCSPGGLTESRHFQCKYGHSKEPDPRLPGTPCGLVSIVSNQRGPGDGP
jgi:hypothetical protein